MAVDPLSSQKHVLFLIPNYDSTGGDADGSPLSYLKLGSAESSTDLGTKKLRGDDLLEAAGLSASDHGAFFVDDQRQSACANATDSEAVGYRQETHYDSAHSAGECLDATLDDPGTTHFRSDRSASYTTTESATDLTDQLMGDGSSVYARGGWRDHTDGNRIVTVRGDRVDVVVGNYKRVVFGRVSGFDGSGSHVGPTSTESSGGHLFERTSSDILQHHAIERVQETDLDGVTRWKLVERASQGNVVDRFSGRLTETHNGPIRKRTIGVDSSSTTKNPEITTSHALGTVNTTVDASSVTRKTTVDSFQDVRRAASQTRTHRIKTFGMHKARGKAFDQDYTYKRELYTATSRQMSVFGGRFEYHGGAALFQDHVGWLQISSGIRLGAHAGARIRFNYGSRSRWYAGLWWRATIGAGLNVDLGIYTNMYILYLHKPPPVQGTYFIGDMAVDYMRNDHKITESKALGMMVEL